MSQGTHRLMRAIEGTGPVDVEATARARMAQYNAFLRAVDAARDARTDLQRFAVVKVTIDGLTLTVYGPYSRNEARARLRDEVIDLCRSRRIPENDPIERLSQEPDYYATSAMGGFIRVVHMREGNT